MLKLVLGRSKSGKTQYLKNMVEELARKGEKKLLIIVPDQQTFDTEKAFLDLLGPVLTPNVTVMGFKRLCNYIFENTGYIPGTFADDSVKALLMSTAIEETSPMLNVYSKDNVTSKFISNMLNTRYDLIKNKSNLNDVTYNERFPNSLRDKISDVSLILSAYDALLTQSFEDPDGELSVAYDLLTEHKLFEGYKIFIDSFLSFSALEYDIISELMIEAEDLYITLSDDGVNNSESIFSVSQETEKKLKSIANDNGVKISAPFYCNYEGYFKSEDLKLLERNAFSLRGQDELPETYDNAPLNINIYRALDIYEEADYVARNIKRLVMDNGYSYNDFAIVVRSLPPYRNALENALNNYDISHFIDSPKNVMSTPLMKLIVAVFDTITSGFDSDSILALIKSGLLGFDEVDISLFENYIFTWSIRGKAFLSEFTANPRGFADEFTLDDMAELSKIEEIRRYIILPLEEFKSVVKDTTAKEISRALYNVLMAYNVTENIDILSHRLLSDGEQRLSEEQIRLWEAFVDTLDRTVQVIGNRVVSPKDYAELLKLQFINLDLAYIPRVLDEVTIGDIERMRLSDKKVVFVLGAVKGEFPAFTEGGGLFTNQERYALTEVGIFSDASLELDFTRERYHCYYALTSASDKLFVSYPTHTSKGEENNPSEIIDEITASFPKITFYSFDRVDLVDKLWAEKPAFSLFSRRIGSEDRLSRALEEYYLDTEKYSSKVLALNKAHTHRVWKIENKENTKLLYGDNYYLNATRTDDFYSCKFKYFCRYGLSLNERRKAEMDGLEYGNYVHHILDAFLSRHTKEELSKLSKEIIIDEVTEIMTSYIDSHIGDSKDKSQRLLYMFQRVKSSIVKLILHMIDGLSVSSFVPEAFELSIGKDVPAYTLNLPDGKKITITGRIDRVDVFEKDEKKYIRIVDYKSGKKVFSLKNVLYGLNLQMLIYLSVLCRTDTERYGANLIPAGVLYAPVVVPYINAEYDADEKDIRKEISDKLKTNGLILYEDEVLEAMEHELSGKFMPFKLQKGKLYGYNSLATLEEFGAIFDRIDRMVEKMAMEIGDGIIDAVPIEDGGNSPCKYCRYLSICGHREDDPVNILYKMDRDEISAELLRESEREEGEK